MKKSGKYDSNLKVIIFSNLDKTENEEEAIKFNPSGDYDYKENFVYDTDDRYNTEEYKKRDSFLGSWVKKKYVKIEEIGEANDNQKKGVIVSSFNAG